jgi:glucose-1-phosphate thymidylyltransferase
LAERLRSAGAGREGATIFGYAVDDPERYGVIEFDGDNRVLSIEEKPKQPKSSWAVVGVYVYDNDVLDIAAGLTPSSRGETEITDVIAHYLRRGQLRMVVLGRGMAWLDTGTHESLHDASSFIETIEKRQGLKVACPEEVAYRMGWIGPEQVERLAHAFGNGYGDYLREIISDDGPASAVEQVAVRRVRPIRTAEVADLRAR